MSIQPPPLPGTEPLPPSQATSRVGAELAGYGRRLAGRIIDDLLLTIPWMFVVFATVLNPDGASRTGVFLGVYLGMLILTFLNEVGLTATKGGTVGKLLLGMEVVRLENWKRVGPGIAARRWAAMLVMNLIPFLGFIDALWIFSGELHQTLHDKFAQTVVIRRLS